MTAIYAAAFLLAACYNVLWTQYSIATHARHGGRAFLGIKCHCFLLRRRSNNPPSVQSRSSISHVT